MIYSMTGYAAKAVQINSATLQLEIKSVNHRFLDITIKSAEELKPLENTLRNLVAEHITRGKLDIKLFFKESKDEAPQLSLNQAMLQQYLALVAQIDQQLHNHTPLTAAQILAVPGILTQPEYNLEELQTSLMDEFTGLINTFKKTQSAEGEKLVNFLNARLTEISRITAEAKPILEQIIVEYRLKLKQRLTEVLGETEASDNRLQQEFAFFCQKIDVTEELDRLTAHVEEFNKLLTKGGHIGKRLDFICQEMHREANTFGSKSAALDTTKKAVDLKVLVEQIREQVQNIM
jgi:uncharacterized protein (TIGR00255 family)